MRQLLHPLLQGVTYTRWVHLCLPVAIFSVWLFIDMSTMYVPALVLLPVGLIPSVRMEEGMQAQLLLTPAERGRPDARIVPAPSETWADRLRTVVWLELRLLLSVVTLFVTVWLPLLSTDLLLLALGPSSDSVLPLTPPRWLGALLAPLPLVVLYATVVALGRLMAWCGARFLGPSPAQRLASLEERTERLLERNRIARELHDSIGHALTVAVVQAGAAREAGDPDFTDRALGAIEETGRAALEDLDRVLRVLREADRPLSRRPSLAEADRLLDSARASGAQVDVELTGPLANVPGLVSREAYRILQEALTNVVRHAGSVPVRVRVALTDGQLEMEIANPVDPGRSSDPAPMTAARESLTVGGSAAARAPHPTPAFAVDPQAAPGAGSGSGVDPGSGLRGIRERAALLGGHAHTGVRDGEWIVGVTLPVEDLG